jgi:hypothetical protein
VIHYDRSGIKFEPTGHSNIRKAALGDGLEGEKIAFMIQRKM